jgi:hypothetical protein
MYKKGQRGANRGHSGALKGGRGAAPLYFRLAGTQSFIFSMLSAFELCQRKKVFCLVYMRKMSECTIRLLICYNKLLVWYQARIQDFFSRGVSLKKSTLDLFLSTTHNKPKRKRKSSSQNPNTWGKLLLATTSIIF